MPVDVAMIALGMVETKGLIGAIEAAERCPEAKLTEIERADFHTVFSNGMLR
mgnify:CR=1 FL=1